MKAGALSSAAKRRRGPGVAVLALVLCSLFVPLAFLFGRFPSYVTDEGQPESDLRRFDHSDQHKEEIKMQIHEHSDGNKEEVKEQIDDTQDDAKDEEKEQPSVDPVTNEQPTVDLQKDGVNTTKYGKTPKLSDDKSSESNVDTVVEKEVVSTKNVLPSPFPVLNRTYSGDVNKKRLANNDEAVKACQLEFGSYCLWSIEHKEVMKDSVVKRLKDQLFVARAYYPSIAKLNGKEALTHDLKQSIQDHEKILSECSIDDDLPSSIGTKINTMEQVIYKAKSCPVECTNIDRKLCQILDMTEDEAHFHMKQSAFLYNLGVQTMPKSHHCLSMRLTVEYFKANVDPDDAYRQMFDAPEYRHYVIFSRNVLAASVVINSTFSSSQAKEKMAFHVLTDAENYYAMKIWFARSPLKNAALRVINYEDFVAKKFPYLDLLQLHLPEEFRVSIHNTKRPIDKTRMEYLSVFSHSHFLLPEIFNNLKKVVVLDDDMVVQRDLSFLWNLNMGNKVNGAVKFCGLRFGQLRMYLGHSTYNPESCAWMSGLNIIDLGKWREHKISEKYKKLLQQFKGESEASTRAAALPISLLVFENLIYPLDEKWVLSRLGYDYDIEEDTVSSAISLHYNGNMKPWFDLGIPQYKSYWRKFLTNEERFMDDCNAHL